MIPVAMDLEISDFPPPETVEGLWQRAGVGTSADQPPHGAAGLLLQPDTIAGRQDIDVAGTKRQLNRRAVVLPVDKALRGH